MTQEYIKHLKHLYESALEYKAFGAALEILKEWKKVSDISQALSAELIKRNDKSGKHLCR